MVCDSGDYWSATLIENIRYKAHMHPLMVDPSLYIKQTQIYTIGILESYFDDCLFAGNDSFNDVIKMTTKRFESKPVK